VVSNLLAAERFVTIVGTGGVGKTTVAVAIAHELIDAFAGAVLFIDLGLLITPDLTGTAVASMLGLSVQSDDATPSLIAYLRDKRILLVLDTWSGLTTGESDLSRLRRPDPGQYCPGQDPVAAGPPRPWSFCTGRSTMPNGKTIRSHWRSR
jgi:hypothetical protein